MAPTLLHVHYWLVTVTYIEVATMRRLPVTQTLKSLGVVLDQTSDVRCHATAVAKSCNYQTDWSNIKHVRHLLSESVAPTLACSLINSWLDYCNTSAIINAVARLKYKRRQIVLFKSRTG